MPEPQISHKKTIKFIIKFFNRIQQGHLDIDLCTEEASQIKCRALITILGISDKFITYLSPFITLIYQSQILNNTGLLNDQNIKDGDTVYCLFTQIAEAMMRTLETKNNDAEIEKELRALAYGEKDNMDDEDKDYDLDLNKQYLISEDSLQGNEQQNSSEDQSNSFDKAQIETNKYFAEKQKRKELFDTQRKTLSKLVASRRNNNTYQTKQFQPILTKEGYVTDPPYDILQLLTEDELKKIAYFQIFNEHGAVTFLESTDLTYVNFDDDVIIDKFEIEIYPNSQDKPAFGNKLNKSAILTFNTNFYLENSKENYSIDHDKIAQSLKEECQKQSAIFMFYDKIAEIGLWEIKVYHF